MVSCFSIFFLFNKDNLGRHSVRSLYRIVGRSGVICVADYLSHGFDLGPVYLETGVSMEGGDKHV